MNLYNNLALLRSALANGPASASELCRTLGISQPSFSRLVKHLEGAVLQFGRARGARYALKRNVRGLALIFKFIE